MIFRFPLILMKWCCGFDPTQQTSMKNNKARKQDTISVFIYHAISYEQNNNLAAFQCFIQVEGVELFRKVILTYNNESGKMNLSSFCISVAECVEIVTSTFYKLFFDQGRNLWISSVRSTNMLVESSLLIWFYLLSLSPWTPHFFGFPLLGLVLLLRFWQYFPFHYGNVAWLLLFCAPVRSAVQVSRLLVLSRDHLECLSNRRGNEINLVSIPLAFGFCFLPTLPFLNCGTQLLIPEAFYVSGDTNTSFAGGNLKIWS